MNVGGGAVECAETSGERRFVFRRQQRGGQDQIRDAVAQGAECALGRRFEHELRIEAASRNGLQLARLMAIGFDGEDERHYIRTMKSVSMAAAIAKISIGACARL